MSMDMNWVEMTFALILALSIIICSFIMICIAIINYGDKTEKLRSEIILLNKNSRDKNIKIMKVLYFLLIIIIISAGFLVLKAGV